MELSALVPFLHVQDVPRSIAFYERLGFVVGQTHAPQGRETPVWAWLRSGAAHLMVAQSDAPLASHPAVMLYVYCADVEGYRRELLEAGVEAGTVTRPFYNPGGEFRVTDPDGYVLMVAHT